MPDFFKVNGKSSYTDFDLLIKEHQLSTPQKQKLKKTIPFMSGAYDFSDISGEVCYNERELKYVVDIAELTLQEVEEKKQEILNWLLPTPSNAKIEDSYIPNFYFIGNFDDASFSADQEQGELTIIFLLYPYLYSKEEKVFSKTISEDEVVNIINNSSHPIITTVSCDKQINIKNNNVSYSFASGTYENSNFILYPGLNNLEVSVIETNTNLSIKYREEVF